MTDISPPVVREMMADLDMGGSSYKIIFLKSINRQEDFARSADLILVKPPDHARITAFINSFSGI